MKNNLYLKDITIKKLIFNAIYLMDRSNSTKTRKTSSSHCITSTIMLDRSSCVFRIQTITFSNFLGCNFQGWARMRLLRAAFWLFIYYKEPYYYYRVHKFKFKYWLLKKKGFKFSIGAVLNSAKSSVCPSLVFIVINLCLLLV